LESQPEIEIYLKECPMEKLIKWQTRLFGNLEPAVEAGDAEVFQSRIGPIIVTPVIENSEFISVWFNTPKSPWPTDVECGRQASIDLECVVRCDPGQHFPEVPAESDIFLEIENKVESLIIWE
jgi:hypothetical protein